MTHHIRTNGQLTLSASLSQGLKVTAVFEQGLSVGPRASDGRRAQRALRTQAMFELAVAWTDPASRQITASKREG